MKGLQEQMIMFMLMDLVDHELLTMEEAESAKMFYSKSDNRKHISNLTDDDKAA